MKKKSKKKSKKIIILSLFVILLLGAYFIYNKYYNSNEDEVKVINTITKYNYTLKENETEIYKDEFSNLKKILKEDDVDYEKYAISISKLFIIDFYTLSNKLSKNDIGGTQFIKEDMRDNFIDQARNTFYRYIEVNNKNQDLPTVKGITDVSVQKTTFGIKDLSTTTTSSSYYKKTTSSNVTQVDAYKVSISWEYEDDYGYETKANLVLIKDNKKLAIVEMD